MPLPAPAPDLAMLIGATMVGYVVLMFVLSYVASRRVANIEDYVVAGRRLPLMLAVPTLLATWFCGGTLLTVTDEVRARGLSAAGLDPLGAGVCLILAGLFFAAPLWRMKLLTLPDFFRRQFGTRAEVISACLMIPTYFGWIAVRSASWVANRSASYRRISRASTRRSSRSSSTR
jgi:Na+/proline symporter